MAERFRHLPAKQDTPVQVWVAPPKGGNVAEKILDDLLCMLIGAVLAVGVMCLLKVL